MDRIIEKLNFSESRVVQIAIFTRSGSGLGDSAERQKIETQGRNSFCLICSRFLAKQKSPLPNLYLTNKTEKVAALIKREELPN